MVGPTCTGHRDPSGHHLSDRRNDHLSVHPNGHRCGHPICPRSDHLNGHLNDRQHRDVRNQSAQNQNDFHRRFLHGHPHWTGGRCHDAVSWMNGLQAWPTMLRLESKHWVENDENAPPAKSGWCVSRSKSGDVLLSQEISLQVPSALTGLTSVFGMGTGVTLSLWSPKYVVNLRFRP